MDAIGKVVSVHRANAIPTVILFLLGSLFALVGAGLLLIADHAVPEGRTLVIGSGAGLFGVGLVALVGGAWLKKGSRLFVLSEEGVRVVSRKGICDFRFAEIAETVQTFRAGGSFTLAFRKEGQSDWEHADVSLSRYTQFRRAFLESYVAVRLPRLLAALASNQRIGFKSALLPGPVPALQAVGGCDRLRAEEGDIIVSRDCVVINGRTMPINSIVDGRYDRWLQALVLKTVSGEEVSVESLSFLEPELMIAFFEHRLSKPLK